MRLTLHLLGSPEVHLDGEPVSGFVSDKARALLFYLAVEAERAHRRETLAGLLWPDYPERSARTNLSNALSNLRAVIGDREAAPPYLCVSRETIQFNEGSDHWLDVAEYGALVDGQRWEEAAALYQGSFLEGFSVPDSAPFEQWALVVRERLQRQMTAALEGVVAECEERGDDARAQEAARRQLEIEPWHEGAHRALMRALALSGERASALSQYEQCRSVLEAELGIEPSPETMRLAEQIREGEVQEARPAKRGSKKQEAGEKEAGKHNLPAQLIPFVGREGTLAEIEERLRDPGCRLLTLVGPGGSGKTRLALEAAARQVDRYPDGAWFVSLAPLRSVEAIVPTVAQALGFAFYGGNEPKEQLLNYLRQKTLLLVLDNAEHLLEGAGLVPDILRAAPEVKALVTSRAALNVEGEQRFPIAGMDYPSLTPPAEDGRLPSPASRPSSVGRRGVGGEGPYDAVQLFAASARRAQPGFELTDDNLADVVRICRLVDGMPLALLLAAAWLKVLAPAEIADQIEPALEPESGRQMTGLDFLASDQRDIPERQRSMRAVFDHSSSLLTARERAVMQALSVFRGGCTRKAAQQVTGATLRDLMSLVDRSLLQRTPTGRYEVHELLRQYAAEKLGQAPSAYQAAHDGHCAYYAAALARWAVELKGPRQQATLAEMDAEIDNARAAWEWAVERVSERAVEWLGQAMEGLGMFYDWRALCQEGESAFHIAADRLAGRLPPDVVYPLRAQALTWQAYFCQQVGRKELARDLLRQSLDLLDTSALADTRRERAFALYVMGEVEWDSGTVERAWQKYMQALALYRALDQPWEIALALANCAMMASSLGEYDRARGLLQEALAIWRKLGDQRGLARSLVWLGIVLGSLGQPEQREPLTREALAIARKMGDRVLISEGLNNLAWTLNSRGEFAEVRLLAEECLSIAKDLGAGLSDKYGTAQNILGTAMAHLGQYEGARAHIQQALALAQEADRSWSIGYNFFWLGLIALAEGNHDTSRQYLQEGTAVWQEHGRHADVSWLLAGLAGAMRGLGRLSEARELLCEALQIDAKTGSVMMLVTALPVAALLLADLGKTEQAVEIYALACRFGVVGNSRLWEDIAGRQIATLAATLPPEVVAAAQERGRARELWATVDEVLAELEE